MSGGAYDYAYTKVWDFAGELRVRHKEPLVRALASHLLDVSDLMKDIEWADSGDTDWTEGMNERIRMLIGPGAEVEEATRRARSALADLTAALNRLGQSAGDD